VSKVIVRESVEADLEAIEAVYAHHVAHGLGSFEETPPSREELARRRADVLARSLPYLVAVDTSGKLLGYAYAGPYRTRSAYRHTVENSVYVAPGAARQGVGRVLLAALIAHCETAGFRQMVAVIGDSGNTGSIGLHEALGFRRVGTLEAIGWKHGRWVDSVLMQRALGPGGDSSPG
jgi:L-amino acid N-acyltransferase YncA